MTSFGGDYQIREVLPPQGESNLLSVLNWHSVMMQSDARPQFTRVAADTTQTAQGQGDRGPFDANVPLSAYDDVAKGVHRSARPKGAAGVEEIVTDIFGSYDAQNASKTTIIDLRGPVKGQWAKANDQEIKEEQDASAQRGITHKNFSFDSHKVQDPAKVQAVLDYIDSEVARGQEVLFHCYHGRDRSGLIAAAYKMTHDPTLEAQLKKDPKAAFQTALDDMKAHNFNPVDYPEMVKSLKNFTNWKSKELNHPKHHKHTADIIDLTADIYSKAS